VLRLRGSAQSKMCIFGGTTRARVAAGGPSWRRFVYLEIIPSVNIQILDGKVSVSRARLLRSYASGMSDVKNMKAGWARRVAKCRALFASSGSSNSEQRA
jgi:hypothetical protein